MLVSYFYQRSPALLRPLLLVPVSLGVSTRRTRIAVYRQCCVTYLSRPFSRVPSHPFSRVPSHPFFRVPRVHTLTTTMADAAGRQRDFELRNQLCADRRRRTDTDRRSPAETRRRSDTELRTRSRSSPSHYIRPSEYRV